MKIAIDARGANWYKGTGIGTYTNQVLNYLLNNDSLNQYHLYWAGPNYRNIYKDNVTINMSSKRHHRFFEDYFIPQNLKNNDVDIYHVPQNGIGLSKKTSCLSISTIHDLIPYVMPETVGRGYLKKFIAQMPSIIQASDNIITVSEFSKNDIIKIFDVPEEKIKVTHLAADHIFSPLDKEETKKSIYEKYGITEDFILYLGGFSSRKNVKSILVAFSKIYKNLSKDYKVVILGPSRDEHEKLTNLAETLSIKDKVQFTGFVPHEDLPLFYNAASLFVYPSLYEGFGLPPLEAMSCKCPVITSDISAIPEVVGDGALLINPYDIDDLKDSMEKVLEDSSTRENIILKGYERSKLFSWEITAKKTLQVYKDLYKTI
ncbi:glycosyltransferase family 4 protein [Clostridium cylindrosporum]|uniref:D-inositol 3-phosphate glycosyltransferase MshA n=1 Tax=Clostridium cylindrosporum DSM 605 TaxID=1121307 RepID=A0A0J8DEZ7_CLOCY|nr:glycosyltransferase family 1 protein [Clostridium cylindrosporum]KMT22834.1 D-inositol 3-phosphate glycosyltransferase MshA [Clostridium cylindrosporum DSM 605]